MVASEVTEWDFRDGQNVGSKGKAKKVLRKQSALLLVVVSGIVSGEGDE